MSDVPWLAIIQKMTKYRAVDEWDVGIRRAVDGGGHSNVVEGQKDAPTICPEQTLIIYVAGNLSTQ